jgi:hypothetical protein
MNNIEMTYHIIPRKREQESSGIMDIELNGMVTVLPAGLGQQARNYIDESHATLAITIITLEAQHAAEQRSYVKAMKETYDTLMQAIASAQAAQAGSKKLRHAISGDYDTSFRAPSIENWSKYNPGKMAAINYVIHELRLGGWQPDKLRISEFTVDHDDGMYSGGHEVTVTCDFN